MAQGAENRRPEPSVPSASSEPPRGVYGLVIVAALVVILAGMRAASGLVAETLLGLMLAVAALPVLFAARRLGFPTVVGAAMASATLLVLGAGFGVLIAVAGGQLGKLLPRFQAAVLEARRDLRSWLETYDAAPVAKMLEASFELTQFDVLPRILDAASSIGSIGFVLFVALFALFEAPTFEDKWRRVTTTAPQARAEAGRVLQDVQRYLVVKTGTSLATGLLVGLLTALLGLEAAAVWGLLAFALNYIPFIGSLLAGIPPTIVALVTQDILTAVATALGVASVNFTIGNIIEPRVMGRAMGLSPLVVLLSVALWGYILGPVGALLSVPLTVIVKLILHRSDRFRWISVLLASPITVAAIVEPDDEDDGW